MSEKSKQNPNQKMRVKFITLGCKVNQYETQALREIFVARGCTITNGVADLYVINTCTVTARADTKSKEAFMRAKKENPHAKRAVCGCLAQFDQERIQGWGTDYIIPQENKAKTVDIILGDHNGTKIKKNHSIWSLRISGFFNYRAFLKVEDGCDNFCSFCRVPYARGVPHSRPQEEVIQEVKRLSRKHKEIVVCGTNLGRYGKDFTPASTLVDLLRELLTISSVGRIRLSSLEPYLVTDELLFCFKHPKMCPHLHFAFQYGDDKVLRSMNRKERVQFYDSLVKKARHYIPHIALSCDIMVGFPAEDEETFNNTVLFLKRTQPMRMHIFTFSPRPSTALAKATIKNQKVVRRRYNILRALAGELSSQYRKHWIGKTLHMVAEERVGGYTCGYTENYIKVYVKESISLGEIIPVVIERVEDNKTWGSLPSAALSHRG